MHDGGSMLTSVVGRQGNGSALRCRSGVQQPLLCHTAGQPSPRELRLLGFDHLLLWGNAKPISTRQFLNLSPSRVLCKAVQWPQALLAKYCQNAIVLLSPKVCAWKALT